MQVKDLIKALEQCDQEAEVYTEGYSTNEVFEVAEYTSKRTQGKVVRIGDDFTYVDEMVKKSHIKRSIV